MRACLRILPLFALLAAIIGLGTLASSATPASADLIVSVQSCSGGTCTLILNYTVNAGGSFMVTVNDPGATVTACAASANDATCTTSGNSATFNCNSTCAQNNKYTITLSGGTGTPDVSTRILSPGNLSGGGGSSAGSISVNVGTTTTAATTAVVTRPVATTTVASVPAGGQCVASIPTNLGCTSIGGFGFGGACGSVAGCVGGCGFSFSSCGFGGFNGCGFSFNSCGFNTFNGCTTFVFNNCGGCNFFVFGNCNINNNNCLGFIIQNIFCPSNCTPGLVCGTSNTTTTTGARCIVFPTSIC
jgi:hypothetical protein